MKEYTVYVHKNLKNDKYYVGCTSKNPSYRWNNGKGYQNNSKMWSDIQNSDWNKDWVHGILGKFDNKKDALKYEAFLIAMLNTTENGYNTSAYDSNRYKHSEEHRKKTSEAMTGKHHTEESKKRMSEAHTGKHHSEETKKKMSESKIGEKHPMFGKHHSEETKQRMSESMTGEKNHWYGKHLSEETKKKMAESHGVNGILQYSKTGEFIAEYPSIWEAERQTGCYSSNICSCCKGKLKSTGGYLWRYAS